MRPLAFVWIVLSAFSFDDGADRKLLQGTWTVSLAVEGGTPQDSQKKFVIFDSDTMILRDGTGDLKLLFSIDSAKTPREIDFRAADEKQAKEFGVLPGIYKFDGESLHLCVPQGDPKEVRRPTDFESKQGSNVLFMKLQRSKR